MNIDSMFLTSWLLVISTPPQSINALFKDTECANGLRKDNRIRTVHCCPSYLAGECLQCADGCVLVKLTWWNHHIEASNLFVFIEGTVSLKVPVSIY